MRYMELSPERCKSSWATRPEFWLPWNKPPMGVLSSMRDSDPQVRYYKQGRATCEAHSWECSLLWAQDHLPRPTFRRPRSPTVPRSERQSRRLCPLSSWDCASIGVKRVASGGIGVKRAASGARVALLDHKRFRRTSFTLAPMRTPGSDAPCARERGAWLEPDQGVPGPKCVWRAGHGLDGKAVPVDVGKRVAAEEHQVARAHPHRRLPLRPPRWLYLRRTGTRPATMGRRAFVVRVRSFGRARAANSAFGTQRQRNGRDGAFDLRLFWRRAFSDPRGRCHRP